jgi:hypothetical protein
MIDADHLENARAVWEDPETGSTKISDDVWPKDNATKLRSRPGETGLVLPLNRSVRASRF